MPWMDGEKCANRVGVEVLVNLVIRKGTPMVAHYDHTGWISKHHFYRYVAKVRTWAQKEVARLTVEKARRLGRPLQPEEEFSLRVEVRDGECLLYQVHPVGLGPEPELPREVIVEAPTGKNENQAAQLAIQRERERRAKLAGGM